MPVTDDQKLRARMFLGITREEAQATGGLFALMDALTDLEVAALEALLVLADGLSTNATEMEVDGVRISPSAQRALVTARLNALIGLSIEQAEE